MTRVLAALLVVSVMLPLVSCGKVGSPNPPGPASKVIYPRAYPKPD